MWPRAAATKGAPATTAKLDVIETIPMETYLAGVVGAELYKDWPETAFKVQAVCARTYALHERERANSQQRDFDLESTTADQAYSGGAHLPVAVKAVSETRGVVVTWQGQLLRAYYSSTCGGRTASAADIWPTGPGYEFNLDAPIQAHHRESACEISPRYRWEAVRDRVELSKRVKEWGRANAHAGREARADQPGLDHRNQRGWQAHGIPDRGRPEEDVHHQVRGTAASVQPDCDGAA
jgi:SpoIID/LytB domain protein